MKTALLLVPLTMGAVCALAASSLDRTILPIAAPEYTAVTEFDVRNTTLPPRFEFTAPKGVHNVVIILIDDRGFGATSTFGSTLPTSTFDQL